MAASSTSTTKGLRSIVLRDSEVPPDSSELSFKTNQKNKNLTDVWVEWTDYDDKKHRQLLGTYKDPDQVIENTESEGWGRYVVGERPDIQKYFDGDIELPGPGYEFSESSIRQALIKANGDPVKAAAALSQ